MRFALAVFYRRRGYFGFENIPDKGPVIFACNHPNSFLDAMIVGAHLKRETHFLARSDVFNSPLKLWILSQFKMMPIYRLSEGKEDLGKNKDTFEKCHDVFRKGGAVLMFSEGICIQEMRLRPLKKGTARIAMEYSKDGSPLTIIPTGLNYLKPGKFREGVMIAMDKPFNAADFATEYDENNGKGIQSFNKRLLEGLQNSVIDIRDRSKEKTIEQLLEIEYHNTKGDVHKLIAITRKVNELQATDSTHFDELINKLIQYKDMMYKQNVNDEVVSGVRTTPLLLLPALPVFGLVFWIYLIPIGLATTLVNKKVKLAEFHDSVLIGASVVFTFVYWMILLTIVSILFNFLVGLGVIVFFILIAFAGASCYDIMQQVRYRIIYKKLEDFERYDLEKLRKEISLTIAH